MANGAIQTNWEQAYYQKLNEFAAETQRTSRMLVMCERRNVPHHVVGEALLGYWAAQDQIRKVAEDTNG